MKEHIALGHAKKITEEHKRQFEAVIGDLESAAGRLERLERCNVFALLPLDWGLLVHRDLAPDGNSQTVSLEDLPDLLREIIKFMREGLHKNWNAPWRLSTMTASAFLPKFVRMIRERTDGKPHYKDLAILLSNVYGKPISWKYLKVIARGPRPDSK